MSGAPIPSWAVDETATVSSRTHKRRKSNSARPSENLSATSYYASPTRQSPALSLAHLLHSPKSPKDTSDSLHAGGSTEPEPEDELDSEGDLGSEVLETRGPSIAADLHMATNRAWTYTLEVVQQPQRARACGFGDKDRRPLSPPPILRLCVWDAAGRPVDPAHVSVHFLVLAVDLWSADSTQQRNVVMHPSSQLARHGSNEYFDSHAAEPSGPMTGHAPRPDPYHNLYNSQPFAGHWRMTSSAMPGVSSPDTSPLSHSATEGLVPPPLPYFNSASTTDPTRPPYSRNHSHLEKEQHGSLLDKARPFTAPSSSRPRGAIPPPLNLPALHTIAHLPSVSTRPMSSGSLLTLPALHDHRFSVASNSSAASSNHVKEHRVSWSTESSRGSFADAPGLSSRPSTSWTDRHPVSRPSTAGGPITPTAMAIAHFDLPPYLNSESSMSGYPRTPEAPRFQLAGTTPNYSRVLVGSLTAVCQRLQDQNGNTGLFFFAHDLGIRTEGTFTLKFSLSNLASLMSGSITLGESATVLAHVYSDPFTVYSAKRFPGVVPTTDLTRLFASQNVRLPTRQKRVREGSAGDSINGEIVDDE